MRVSESVRKLLEDAPENSNHTETTEWPIDRVLAALERLAPVIGEVTERGRGWRARCPSHIGDSTNSLSVTEAEDGTALLHCFQGCDTAKDVVPALALRMADLFPNDDASRYTKEWAAEQHERAAARAANPTTSDFFDDRGAFIPPRLGAYLNRERPIRLGEDGRIYCYVDGVYHAHGEGWVKKRTRELLGERCRRRHIDEVLAWLKADEETITAEPDERFLNLPNGLLDWRTGELRPHSPDVLSTIRIPVAWKPDATCPTITRFLGEVLPHDSGEFALEIIAYGLYPANPFQKAVLLLGPGGNGKGKLLQVVRALLGSENVSTRTLHDFADDHFAAADLFGRLANICGDLDARNLERSDTFKMVTGGDPITGQRKYGHSFSFVAFALLLFSANEAPLSSDQTTAYFDRWLVVPMTERFRGTAREDPTLGSKLTTARELEGLLQLAVPALRRLIDRGYFAVPGSVREAGEKMRDELDSVAAFVSEWCVLHADAKVARADLYGAYVQWCRANGRQPLNSKNAYARLRENFPRLREVRQSYGWRVDGIRVSHAG